jgi:tetrahydromethanopterin S-methyltransferase subunit F
MYAWISAIQAMLLVITALAMEQVSFCAVESNSYHVSCNDVTRSPPTTGTYSEYDITIKAFGSDVCTASTLKRTKSYSSKVCDESDYVDDYYYYADDYYYSNSTRYSNYCLVANRASSSTSLSGGAIAGIVIGGVFGVLLLGLCLYYCYKQMGSKHSSIGPE